MRRAARTARETGFTGRTGIFEVLEVDDPIRRLIARNAPDHEIRRAAVDQGMCLIGQDGVKRGPRKATTLDEVLRVVHLGDEGMKICGQCSETMPREFEHRPACGKYAGEQCATCHRRLQPDWKHCPGCGRRSRAYDPARPPRPPRTSTLMTRPSSLQPRPPGISRTKKAS